ncbi:hypothetical protein CCR85_03715 [Rhodothalassium salexigens]|uniref:protein adenylyltransferase SelO n=1 Tax=Rhodothalassium salexigens TaxID=1086 RepID=UPI001912C0D8|nr:YdiU family protein [Rhodothalassium salexigens]MBK5910599.1 hypothetical protein [Rhodothalassium salexigens]MBK5920336.1 hypothetical protein [Rhodothalassium salexigens]
MEDHAAARAAAPDRPGASPLAFDNSYARLPDRFFARLAPTPVSEPRLLRVNHALAERLGTNAAALSTAAGVAMLAGNRVPSGAEPLAMAYAGHQFGQYNPQLGDGRALLLGEVVGTDGVRYDIQLKGSGRTPFSRMGDGRSALGPVIREYIVSEAMAALGVPTTRALAMVATGDRVLRQDGPEPGGVMTRVARGHVRVGTFEFFRNQGDLDALRRLADYVIDRHYPTLKTAERRYHALLDAVVAAQAELVAAWLALGFIHGVMNTDNCGIAGETIDYGPCAFMDRYHPETVYSSIDLGGRYAFNRQPQIAQWNLARLAECLLPLMADDPKDAVADAEAALSRFAARFDAAHLGRLRAKLGLATAEDDDHALALDLLAAMADNRADFTLTFRRLSDLDGADPAGDAPVRALFDDASAFDAWATRWRARLARETRDDATRQAAMRATNPAFIPRNHRIQQAIDAAYDGQMGVIDDLMAVFSRPYDDQPAFAAYAEPPEPHEVVQQTFCGT